MLHDHGERCNKQKFVTDIMFTKLNQTDPFYHSKQLRDLLSKSSKQKGNKKEKIKRLTTALGFDVEKLVAILKKLKSPMYTHKKSSKSDILIMSNPRSGSTLLMDMISLESGVKTIDEPLYKNRSLLDDYVKNKRWRYVSLTKDERIVLKEYFEDIIDKTNNDYYDISSKKHDFITERALLKVIRAPGLLDWFLRNFDNNIIYLIRHPIPTSLSRIRAGWTVKPKKTFERFFRSKVYQEKFLDRKIKKFIYDKIREGTKLDLQIIYWCLENIYSLSKIEDETDDSILLTYEELVINTKDVVNKLISFLNLDPTISKDMKDHIQTPSTSSRFSKDETKEAIKEGDKMYLVEKWRSQVDPEQIKSISNILRRFDIDHYKADKLFPKNRYSHFGFD